MKLKNITAVFAAAVAICTSLPMCASADSLEGPADTITDGSFEYEKTDDGLIITKCTADYIVKIPDVQNGVRIIGIGENAFANKTGITELIIPDTITEIGNFAFMGCSNVKTLKLPKKLEKLGEYAFYGCSGIETAEIPSTLGEIPVGTFRMCDHLEEIVIPDNITKIGDYAFYQCTSLKEISLPDSLVSLGEMSLAETLSLEKIDAQGCAAFVCENNILLDKDRSSVYAAASSVKGDLYIPETVTNIKPGAFSSCPEITNLFIPGSVETIGYGAFSSQVMGRLGYCTAIAKIDFAEGLKSIGEGAFSYSSVESLLLPSTLKDIGSGAFTGCYKLNRVVIPEGVKNIGDGAFLYCEELKNVKLPKSVTNIGEEALGYTVKDGEAIKLEGFSMSVTGGTAAEKYARSNGISYTVEDKDLKRIAFVVIGFGLIAAGIVFGIVLMARSKKRASSGAKKAKKLAEEQTEAESYENIIGDDEE